MFRPRLLLSLLMFASGLAAQATTTNPAPPAASAPRFPNGLPTEPSFFPLGVWLQSPHNAAHYRELGINLYVGLFQGPTVEQLDALDQAGMRTICEQNEVGLARKGPTIVGWMHGDEPDNAQGRRLSGYAPPIAPARIVADYEQLRRKDPTRPILLNLGQGAAWDGWYGRGDRTNHPEDYAEYVKGCDLVSFDIYPVTHQSPAVKDKLEFVGHGVQRLTQWSRGEKPVWAVIETAHVDNKNARPTAEQVRTEVWQAIACGASGIVYFAHEFQPQFVEAGIFAHPEIEAAVKAIDAEVLANAAVLNSPPTPKLVRVEMPADVVAVRAHHHGGALHLFVASLQSEPLRATFAMPGKATGKVAVVGSDEALALRDHQFTEQLPGYAIRHYRIAD